MALALLVAALGVENSPYPPRERCLRLKGCEQRPLDPHSPDPNPAQHTLPFLLPPRKPQEPGGGYLRTSLWGPFLCRDPRLRA